MGHVIGGTRACSRPGACEGETKIRAYERRAGKEAAWAGILGEGGIVLGVMWVEVGGKRHGLQAGLDWLKLREVHVRSVDWIESSTRQGDRVEKNKESHSNNNLLSRGYCVIDTINLLCKN